MAPSIPGTPIKRSFSLPVQPTKVPSSPDPTIEILYTLPSARIVAFTTSLTARPSSSSGSPGLEDQPGTLPWVSRFERTLAVGPLRIYRAPGSVAFLNCANALRPILPKSQCWCVDGDSKFVLSIRPPQYWRIEVPNQSADEKDRVEELKKVLELVLRFEKTPCPFQRDFVVELPEAPKTPVKKRPWKPVERSKDDPPLFPGPASPRINTPRTSSTDSSSSSPLRDYASSEAGTNVSLLELEEFDEVEEEEEDLQDGSEVTCDPTNQDPGIPSIDSIVTAPGSLGVETELPQFESQYNTAEEASLEPSLLESSVAEPTFGGYAGSDDENDRFSDAADDTQLTPRSHNQPAYQPLTFGPEKDDRPQALQSSRSVTAPPVLSLITSPPSKHRTNSPLRSSTVVESDSDFSSSVESFHSVQSWHSPLAPPSPPASGPSSPSSSYPYPHNNIVLPKRPHHKRDTSEITVTPETPRVWDMDESTKPSTSRNSSPHPQTPTLITDAGEKSDEEQFEVLTPPTVRPTIRHRATTSSNSRRRALSPLPPAVNLFSPPRRRSRRLQTARHLPTAIIQKTCEILLSPPSHLFHLMISIASKIAAGEWRGVLSGHGEAVHWDFEDEYSGEGWFEDDYGISLPHAPTKAKTTSANVPGGSWEVD
ncbi:Inheritance of peroxisomes protein 1 domain containing protein [Hyaloscypha variabilis]